jgi:hypothetical protein
LYNLTALILHYRLHSTYTCSRVVGCTTRLQW